MEQFSNDKDKNDKKGAGKGIGMFAAGALAAMTPTPAGHVENTYDTSASDYVTEGIVFAASKEAQETVDALMVNFGEGLSVTAEQVGKVKTAVDAFVRNHPVVRGETVEQPDHSVDSYSSYSPSLDLQTALNIRTDDMNPLLIGLLWKELNHQMKKEALTTKSE